LTTLNIKGLETQKEGLKKAGELFGKKVKENEVYIRETETGR